MRKVVSGALIATAALAAIGSGSARALDCGTQPLPCSELLVELPYSLSFTSDSGKIVDTAGVGTGLTFVDPPSNGSGYLPAKLRVNAGRLQLTTTAGTAEGSANSLDNALGVGIDAPSQVTRIEVMIRNPAVGSGASEQAGLWFGNDEDNRVSLALESTPAGPRVEYGIEQGGSAGGHIEGPVLDLGTHRLTLTLIADPETRTIEALYTISGVSASSLGFFTAPEEFFSFDAAGIDPVIGTNSFGGIFATHDGAAAPLTYYFDDFLVAKERDVGAAPMDLISEGIAFQRSSFTVPNPTSIAVGPDGRVYVSELFGTIHALTLDDGKQVIDDEEITTLGSRLTLGLTIDPASTADDVVLWASHSSPSVDQGVPNSSTVSRLSGPGFADRDDVITGLPRAIANHAVNSIHFGPDGRLYIAAGGNTGAGAPNEAPSEFGDMEEQPLSAALLIADVSAAGFDGSCETALGTYGPPPCDVETYATGLRNIYDFVRDLPPRAGTAVHRPRQPRAVGRRSPRPQSGPSAGRAEPPAPGRLLRASESIPRRVRLR
jgi:hypothetical protein